MRCGFIVLAVILLACFGSGKRNDLPVVIASSNLTKALREQSELPSRSYRRKRKP